MEELLYNSYSEYLKAKYGEKVYKLPINLPITCPNRLNGNSGCIFCADCGTGFEAAENSISVSDQMNQIKPHIERKYKAHKFIAYFQNYTNTFLPLQDFEKYVTEASMVENVVEISISTRPDCISREYLEVLNRIHLEKSIDINIELGLQTANYHTLETINRGHTLAEFIDAVLQIKQYDFTICAHVILNLPWDMMTDVIETAKILSALHVDIVKAHSLYVAKNSPLSELYENGTITVCEKEEYLQRLVKFLDYLDPAIVVERLFSRIPEEDTLFSNWNTSWWKLKDELLELMNEEKHYQGKCFNYLNGASLRHL